MALNRIINDFKQGDTPTWGVTAYTSKAKDTYVDTTGWKVYVTLKSDLDLADSSAEMQISAIMTSANGALGLMSVKPSIAEADALVAGSYFYDFQVLTDGGVIDTLEEGRVKAKQTATKSTA